MTKRATRTRIFFLGLLIAAALAGAAVIAAKNGPAGGAPDQAATFGH